MYKKVESRLLQWEDKMEHVSTHFFIRYASKQCIITYQKYSCPIMTFEANKSINLISNSGCPILHALKINKQYS